MSTFKSLIKTGTATAAEMKDMDGASREMVGRTKGLELVWDRLHAQQPQCGFGSLGVCCTVCHLGPCRIDPFGKGPNHGVCGASAEIITARNLLKDTASGSACHSDHGRHLAHLLKDVGEGHTKGYEIRDVERLKKVSKEFGISLEGKSTLKLAAELGTKMLEEFGKQDGSLVMAQRAPQKQRDLWEKMGVTPRGIDREVVEALAKTHMGVDNDAENLLRSTIRVALSDEIGRAHV